MILVDTAARTLTAYGQTMSCAIGRSGACPETEKREGDGRTPLGRYPARAALLRPDRVPVPDTSLPWRWLRSDDGWSDGVDDPAYNRPVRHPHSHSAERLWRDDGLYDAIVVLGHNDSPPIAGAGSAIFLHCWNDAKPTEGCVAIPRAALSALIDRLIAGAIIEIR